MEQIKIETKVYGWINRLRLFKDKQEGYILKIKQYKDEKNFEHNEIHVWGNNSVEKLRDFLNKNCPKNKLEEK